MLSLNTAFYDLKGKMQLLYDEHESAAIAHEVLAHVTGLDKLQRLTKKDDALDVDQQAAYYKIADQLQTGKPLQYCLGTAMFMGNEYKVNEHVLIPRPETEELVQWVIYDLKDSARVKILDIGTGSGCIPISLKLQLPVVAIASCDISADALAVANENADSMNVNITFLQLDFLNEDLWDQLPVYHVIVSNPPYIPAKEADNMHSNVKDHEPRIALFVPDDDALIFYRTIAKFARHHLRHDGVVYCELHVDHAVQTKEMFEAEGYKDVTLRKDMHGNLRMLRAKK